LGRRPGFGLLVAISRHVFLARFPENEWELLKRGIFSEVIIARDIVPTLYELLDALPEDDADGLRAAFRKAAKANHPDNNPGDPDAPKRFRRVVRAHAILSDDRQRATYDGCLAKAERQRAPNSTRKVFSGFRSLVPNAIAGMVIAFVSIGAFLLIEKVSRMRIAPAQVHEISARASALTAAMPTQTSDTIGRAGEHNKLHKISVPSETEAPDAVKETAAASAVAATDSTGVIPATSDVGVKDAGYYRQRGGLAYRSGDFPLALVDFDLAINLDPNLSDAYIDRAIVFRRMGNLKRAFADIAQAKRIDDLKPQQTAPPSGSN
jgi:curved DNA-binding protein CbpA